MKATLIKSLILSGIFLVTACSTINPYTGEQQTSRAVKYGAIGGVVCGLIEAARGPATRDSVAVQSAPASGPTWTRRKLSCASNWPEAAYKWSATVIS